MKSIFFNLVIVALIPFEANSNAVEVVENQIQPSVERLLQIVQLKLDELFVESSEQVEQLRTELYHLRQSVEHVAWLTIRVERAVQKVQLDNEVLVRNVTQLTSQTDNIILNQQYCANHEALKSLFFDLTPKCLDDQTVRPPPTPSTPTTTEAVEATSTTILSTSTTSEVTESTTTTTTTTEAAETETATTDVTSDGNSNLYARCSQAPPRSGVYWLQRQDGSVFQAFCEQERFGGGLLVFQSRLDGSVDFNRSWNEFVDGFGDPAGEYWLGLKTLHQVAPNTTELVVAMKNFSNVEAYERYPDFWIDDSSLNYRIRITGSNLITGTAGDSLYPYYNEQFVTYDHISNWGSCIPLLGSGFWHYDCSDNRERNNLNGLYGLGRGKQGIWWGTFGNLNIQNTSPLKTVKMMVRY